MMVEFQAAPTDPPAGWAWLDLDAEVIAGLEPASCRAVVASWARERAEGWSLCDRSGPAQAGSPCLDLDRRPDGGGPPTGR